MLTWRECIRSQYAAFMVRVGEEEPKPQSVAEPFRHRKPPEQLMRPTIASLDPKIAQSKSSKLIASV